MDDKAFDSINVVPLVDVMLVLLTIVLMTSTFVATGSLPIQLPQASHTSKETLKSIMIEIDAHGRVYLNTQLLSLRELRTHLKPQSHEIPVIVRADKQLSLQPFVDVIDVLQSLGFKKVSLQTEEKR